MSLSRIVLVFIGNLFVFTFIVSIYSSKNGVPSMLWLNWVTKKWILKLCCILFVLFDILSGVRLNVIVPNVSMVVLFAAVSVLFARSRCISGLLYFISFQVSSFKRFKVAPESNRKSVSNTGFCFVKSCSNLLHWYIVSIHVGLLPSAFTIVLHVSSFAL